MVVKAPMAASAVVSEVGGSGFGADDRFLRLPEEAVHEFVFGLVWFSPAGVVINIRPP